MCVLCPFLRHSCRSLIAWERQVLAGSTHLLYLSATRVLVIRNGKCLAQTGRLVESNINEVLTSKNDPTATFIKFP